MTRLKLQCSWIWQELWSHFFSPICRSSGYAYLPQQNVPLPSQSSADCSGPQQFTVHGDPGSTSVSQFPSIVYVPVPAPAATGDRIQGGHDNLSQAHLDAQKKFLQQQIEVWSLWYMDNKSD